jgi:hypothetical protein
MCGEPLTQKEKKTQPSIFDIQILYQLFFLCKYINLLKHDYNNLAQLVWTIHKNIQGNIYSISKYWYDTFMNFVQYQNNKIINKCIV